VVVVGLDSYLAVEGPPNLATLNPCFADLELGRTTVMPLCS
jgi:hypothetical protein